jgi:hypothetical protein
MSQTSFFIDESGSPNFYAKGKRPLWMEPDFEPVLMLGMIVVQDRRALRKKVLDFQQAILNDPLFIGISSISKPNWYFHASKDHPDVRLKFIEFIRKLEDVSCYIAIGRKLPEVFHQKHNGRPEEFYFDLMNKMLALYDFETQNRYMLYLSQRQSSTIDRFEMALKKTLASQSKLHDAARFNCRITPNSDYPELSIVDYLIWILRRNMFKGGEDTRFFNATHDKFTEIIDIYGNGGKGAIYNAANPFNLQKTGSFFYK